MADPEFFEMMSESRDREDGDPLEPDSEKWQKSNELIAQFFTQDGADRAREVLRKALGSSSRHLGVFSVDDDPDNELLLRISSIVEDKTSELQEPREAKEPASQKAQRDQYEQQERLERKQLKRADSALSQIADIVEPLSLSRVGAQAALEEMISRRLVSQAPTNDRLLPLQRLFDVYADAYELSLDLPSTREEIREQIEWLKLK